MGGKTIVGIAISLLPIVVYWKAPNYEAAPPSPSLIVEEEEESNSDLLCFGDIVSFVAPDDLTLHLRHFQLSYCNDDVLKFKDVLSGIVREINITDKVMQNEAIDNIVLHARETDYGYCKQNGLIVGTRMEIHFNAEVDSKIVTGKITDRESDMFGLATEETGTIWIDCKYQGFPEHLPIDQIVVFSNDDDGDDRILKPL